MQKLTLFLRDSNLLTDNCKSFLKIHSLWRGNIYTAYLLSNLFINVLIIMHSKMLFKFKKNKYFSTLNISYLSAGFSINIRTFYLEDIRVSVKEILLPVLVVMPFHKSVVCKRTVRLAAQRGSVGFELGSSDIEHHDIIRNSHFHRNLSAILFIQLRSRQQSVQQILIRQSALFLGRHFRGREFRFATRGSSLHFYRGHCWSALLNPTG